MGLNATLEELPELEWIVRGKNISIRTIKDRLNRTFSLFESLKDKFPDSKIELSKCAAASYLVTSFEKEFYKTGDEFFGLLSEAYIRNELSEEIERLKVDVENWREKYADLAKQLVEKRSELERYEDAVASLRDSNGAKNADLSDVWEEIERRRNKREGAGTVIEKADAERRAPKKKRERER